MKKVLFVFAVFLISIMHVNASEFKIDSKTAILYQLDENKVLYEKDSDKQISIASLTKIMTCLVAIENVSDLNKQVTITKEVFNGTSELSKAGFKVGDKVTYYDLLYGAMLPSGGDATNALALNISGSINKYVDLMNKKAKELKLTKTHFVNTTGLDAKGHYSSVKDVAALLNYSLKNEKFKKIFTTMRYTTTNGKLKFKSTVLKNASKYNLNTSIIKGAKTGFTDEAGLCMASISDKDNIHYLLVTCGGNTKDNTPHQVVDALTIYNYYYNNYGYKKILKKNQELVTLKVKYSYTKEITFKSNKEIKMFVKNDFDESKVKYEYDGIEVLTPKNKINDKIGKISIIYNGKKLDEYDIYLKKKIESNIPDIIVMIIGLPFAFVIFILLIKDMFKKKAI